MAGSWLRTSFSLSSTQEAPQIFFLIGLYRTQIIGISTTGNFTLPLLVPLVSVLTLCVLSLLNDEIDEEIDLSRQPSTAFQLHFNCID